MKAILGIGIFTLAIWLAVCLLAGQVSAQYPAWVDANGWSPYGGYTTERYYGYVPYDVPASAFYRIYDPYGGYSGYAYYYDHAWGYYDGDRLVEGTSQWNPYARGW